MNSYKKKKRNPAPIIILVLLLCLAAGTAAVYVKRYMPTKERADLDEIYQSEQGMVSLLLDRELIEQKGFFYEDSCYLPLDFVNAALNDRFYWDVYEEKLLYSLPDETLEFLPDIAGESGTKELVIQGDQVYLHPDLVSRYTDIRFSFFDDGYMRLYIDTTWGEGMEAQVRRNTPIRVRGGVKSPIIEDLEKESTVEILETMEKWSKVLTSNGHIGYIQNNRLGNSYPLVRSSSFQAPEYQSIKKDYDISLVWHLLTVREANKGLADMIAKTKGVNTVSPTWYSLKDSAGGFESRASRDYVKNAHDMGLEVWALISDLDYTIDHDTLFGATKNRTTLIANLMKEAESIGFDGINVDIEEIPESAGPGYVQFMRELSIECRKRGLVLSVDVKVPRSWTEHYNRRELGVVTDYVIIMGYDEHYSGSEAGSVSSIGFTADGIKDTIKEVPAEKIINGIPFYTRLWKEADGKTTSEAINLRRAQKLITDHNLDPVWLEEIGQYYAEFEEDGAVFKIWFEEPRSVDLKMQEIHNNGLAGVAGWRGGLESEDIWDIITKYINPE